MSGRKAPGKLAPREGHAKVHQEDKDDRDRQRFRAGGAASPTQTWIASRPVRSPRVCTDFVPFEFGWELFG
jgi:hypothetical protein